MPEFEDMDAPTLRRALALVREHTGITMSETKKAMLQTRLRPRMRLLKVRSYDQYLRRVRKGDGERQLFIDAVTTHQTGFFRTPRLWQYVRDVFLPAWAERHAGRPLRVWSAAAATGEEACTIAICCEELRSRRPDFRYEIVGTDIGATVLEQARRGEYRGSSAAAFQASQPALFERYNASGSTESFMLAAPVRERIVYKLHNLLEASPWRDTFDLVLLRNMLIYFRPDDILTVLHRVVPALREKGLLIVGESESLTALNVPLQFVRPQVYQRVLE